MATETTWEMILQTNSADLLVLIDTERGLEGAVKALGLCTDMQQKYIWGVKDDTIKRNERLLDFIRTGDFKRFETFCDALVKSGQTPIVTGHLSEIKETWSSCSKGSNDPRSSIALKESFRDCLRQNWNYLMERIDNLSEIEAQLKSRGSLTTFQQIQLQDYTEDVHKFWYLLKLLENGSQKLFDDFCEILTSTKKQDLVVTLTPSDTYCALDEVKKTFIEVKLEPASDIERQRKLKEIESEDAYPVSNGGVKGRVLIFSNSYFGKKNFERKGTEYDEANLMDFFKQKLKFKTDIYRNMTSQEMREKLNDEAKNMGDVDVFIVFFMSHGRNGEIYGKDGHALRMSEIVRVLDGKRCRQLAGKPKLIFIQACRDVYGTGSSDEMDGITPVLDMNNLTMIDAGPDVQALPTYHPKADMAIFYATVRGDKSYRREDQGSFFVRHLLDVFTKKAHTEDVITMVTEALRRVHELQLEECKQRQLGEVKSSLLRKVYFVI